LKAKGNFGNYYRHGVKQPRNPWSDGPENITQCPIKPGKNFTQEIIFSDEEGTLWWHAHSDWTRATVHGAIIISPAPNNYSWYIYIYMHLNNYQTSTFTLWWHAHTFKLYVSNTLNFVIECSDHQQENGIREM
jgi:hypothetical protein